MLFPLPLRLLLLLVPLAVVVQADLPVHCLRHEVVGEWRFTLGALKEERSSCGHQRPDKEEMQPTRTTVTKELASGGDESLLMVTMRDPNVAETARDSQGAWTMIYDEGFEVSVGGLNFIAFSNFTYEKNNSDPHFAKYNQSHCGQTMVGWYQDMDRTRFGCFFGEKLQQVALAGEAVAVAPAAKIISAVAKKAATYDAPLDEHTQKKVVSKITHRLNMLQLGWKARTMPKWNGRTMREVNTYAGIKRSAETAHRSRKEMLLQMASRDKITTSSSSHPSAHSFLQRPTAVLQKTASNKSSHTPHAWDWSDVGGKSFLEPVMDQSDCGSCYAASSMRMLTARHKITQNDTEALPWSINFPLMCSEYNQGCKGGYGILTAKWSRDVGLVPATCMRYNTGGSCSLECDLSTLKGKRFRASNPRYVGNWYGNSSVESIKEELHQNGPLVLGLEPSEDFMFYSEGVYKSSTNSKPTIIQSPQEWERVDHAVLLVGWGEENGQQYWKLQNSWGPDWGEDGFFRIALGENEAGIESIAEAADVVEDEQDGKQVAAFFNQLTKGSIVTGEIASNIPKSALVKVALASQGL
jgi:cathepsin C